MGCMKCANKGHSAIALLWLESEARKRRIKIQHMANGSEFIIKHPTNPRRWMKVDGYHKRSNTVFEFYGDSVHGNPRRFKPRSRPNYWSTKTAARLYRETMEREEMLRSLGFNVVTMWEMDFRQTHLFASLA